MSLPRNLEWRTIRKMYIFLRRQLLQKQTRYPWKPSACVEDFISMLQSNLCQAMKSATTMYDEASLSAGPLLEHCNSAALLDVK